MMKQSIVNLLENIKELIHAVIHDYIKNYRSIMVAVQTFISPIVTSDNLKLAREIDPICWIPVWIPTKFWLELLRGEATLAQKLS